LIEVGNGGVLGEYLGAAPRESSFTRQGDWPCCNSSFGLRASGFGLKGVCAAAVIGTGASSFGQTGPLANLRDRYPAVRVYEAGDRVRTVFGAEMTGGETPRDAAETFVAEHGEVFGSWLDLEEFRDVPMRRAPQGLEKRVFMYRQRMDGLPVVDSSFRVVTLGEPGGGAARVTYAAGRVAKRPQGGLPEPSVAPAQALLAAQAHATGARMAQWSEAELVAMYDDAPAGDAVAQPAWRLTGAPDPMEDAYTFYVHAVTGEVARFHSNTAHAMDVTGTVDGNATPADDSTDGLGPDTFATVTALCPNDPDGFLLEDVLVSAFLTGTETLVDEGFTDASGDYTLDVSGSTQVDVFAELKGPVWFVLDGSDSMSSNYPWGDPIDPLPHASNPVTAPATGVDLEFNSTPTEKWTAFVNAHKQMSRIRRWLGAPTDVPTCPVIMHTPLGECDASFAHPGQILNPYQDGALRFKVSSDNTCANPAYSTFIAHEYGHFIAYHVLGITRFEAFHEGFGDTLALLAYDAEIWALNFKGCDSPNDHGRWPRQPAFPPAPAIDYQYPVCSGPCSTGDSFGKHCRGELLSAIWLDLRDALGSSATQDLFLDWMLVAQEPTDATCPGPTTRSQAADDGTLVELLEVADDGDWPAICEVFEGRSIQHPDPTPNDCVESAGRSCYADCDENGNLDGLDFICFQDAYLVGSSGADCDRNGGLDIFDFLCFQDAFTSGCR